VSARWNAWRFSVRSGIVVFHLEIPGMCLVASGLRRSYTRRIVLIERGGLL